VSRWLFLFKVDSLQRQLKSVQSEYREVSLQLDAHRDRSVEEDEQRESEVETSKIALERDLANVRLEFNARN